LLLIFLKLKRAEDELAVICEEELRDKVRCFLREDLLNSEKITPRFLNLLRVKNMDCTGTICDDNGAAFSNVTDRSNYIRKFYENLYSVPERFVNKNLSGCVENFLGPEICNNPTVLGMKLSMDERTRLDRPLMVEELDKAKDECKNNTSPGIDGVSFSFIKRIWSLVRTPLLKYAHCCFGKRKLTKTFNTACIRLIPKKGNLKEIKNWRPISLLSCYYKIISRAINTRLGEVIDKVTSRSQKAYNSKRYIQEVVINLNNIVNYCNTNNKSGIIISIDQKKAFDSILHDFCTDAYRFFGFGEEFIGMMETLGNSREAAIILEDGTLSRPFKLGRGRAQGDCPSPQQYNIGENILLLKIEFDPEFKKLCTNFRIDRPLPVEFAEAVIDAEIVNNDGTEKCDAFADDSSAATVKEYDSMYRLKEILVNFSDISGLECNVEKTAIMYVGPANIAEQNKIRNLGFSVTDSIRCLGFDIPSKGGDLAENFDVAIANMSRIAVEWSLFGLSLPGRISISKTFLVSQVTYLGAILTPDPVRMEKMQGIIDNFVLKGIPWARDRLYSQPDSGGLGILNLEDLIISLKCAWFRRILKDGINDN
jgi:Reverse transcriptase (RNA-dependent DNA polymerase)